MKAFLKGQGNEIYENLDNFSLTSGFIGGDGNGREAFDSRPAGANRCADDGRQAVSGRNALI
jgi:hypothetical protein